MRLLKIRQLFETAYIIREWGKVKAHGDNEYEKSPLNCRLNKVDWGILP
jgi:hypothetical protein